MNRRQILCLGLLSLGGGLPLLVQSREALRIAYFESFSPFSWADKNQVMHGILVDVLDEALTQRMKIPLTHRGFPWVRAQMMVRNGDADAFCTIPTKERRAYTEISTEPLINATYTMFVQRNNPVIERLKLVKTLDDLHPFLHAHFHGSGWARQKLAGMRVDWAPNVDVALLKLAHGRDDVFVDVAEVLRVRIKALGLADAIVELPQVLDMQPFNLCIRKTSPDTALLPDFDKTMRQLRNDGTLSAIYNKYAASPVR